MFNKLMLFSFLMKEDPSSVHNAGQCLIPVWRKLFPEAVGAWNFVVPVKDSVIGGPSLFTVRIEGLFAFQILCYELCVKNWWGKGRKHYFGNSLSFEGAFLVGEWGLMSVLESLTWGQLKSHLFVPGFFVNWFDKILEYVAGISLISLHWKLPS